MKSELIKFSKELKLAKTLRDIFELLILTLKKKLIAITPFLRKEENDSKILLNHFKSISLRQRNLLGKGPLEISSQELSDRNKKLLRILEKKLLFLREFTSLKLQFLNKNIYFNRINNIEIPFLKSKISKFRTMAQDKNTSFFYTINKFLKK